MFSVFNISRLNISNKLYPDLDDQLVRGVEKIAFTVAHHPAGGTVQGYGADRGVFCSGRSGGGVGIQWWLVGTGGVDLVWSQRVSEFQLRTFTFWHGPRAVCQP